MAETFDPYYKWLSIPPKDQPPHHYRLLGLEAFEKDLEVIEAAANRQMIYIQGCATGQYVAFSQRLLNEIAQARLALLDPARKTAYDLQLRAKLKPAEETKLAPAKEDTAVSPKRSGGMPVVKPSGRPAGDEGTGVVPIVRPATIPMGTPARDAPRGVEVTRGGGSPAAGGPAVSFDLPERTGPASRAARVRKRAPLDRRLGIFIVVGIVLTIVGVGIAQWMPGLLHYSPSQTPSATAPTKR